jgi:arylsulfatase A-like enzyme
MSETIGDTLIACQKLTWLPLALSFVVALTPGSVDASEDGADASGAPGNIVIFLMDDVGIDKLSVYGSHPGQPHTPNIDSFASKSAVFQAAYSQPTCTPTRASIMTGQFGRRSGHGVRIPLRDGEDQIPLKNIFIPEMLMGARKSYESSAVGKWHMASQTSSSGLRHPLLQGFGWYAGAYGNLGGESENYNRFLKTVNGSEPVMIQRYATTDTVDDAISRMNTMQSPWFLYVSLNAAHHPYHDAPAELRTSVDQKGRPIGSFESMIEAIDHEFGRFIAGIPANQASQTTVFLLSDNGTPSEHIRPPFQMERGKKSLYDGGTHVPLIVKGPTVSTPDIQRDQLVHVVDLFPTIAELAGVRLGHKIDGVSFGPALRDSKVEGQTFVYSERFRPNGPPPYVEDQRMIRSRHWKLIRRSQQLKLPDGPKLKEDEFFAMQPGKIGEGRNLLARPLTREAAAAYHTLAAELERTSANLTYVNPASEPE